MIKIVKKITMIAAMTAVMLTTTITPTISTTTSSTTTVFAASGYSGKIYKHWCRMRKSKSKKAKTIKKLKSKKRYYVQIRAYKTNDHKKNYGNWSAKKTLKTK